MFNVGIQSVEEVQAAKEKGYTECKMCRVYKPDMPDNCLCFSCDAHCKKHGEPTHIHGPYIKQ